MQLKDPSLTSNQRNCVIVRRGEKMVLQYYVDLADTCIPYLEMPWSELKKVTSNRPGGKSVFSAAALRVITSCLAQLQPHPSQWRWLWVPPCK